MELPAAATRNSNAARRRGGRGGGGGSQKLHKNNQQELRRPLATQERQQKQVADLDVMMPDEWFPHETQFELLAAGLKAPVNVNGLSTILPGFPEEQLAGRCATVSMPFIADDAIKHVWRATGGNPLAREPRDKMCLLITPVVPGVSYDNVFYGRPAYKKELDGGEGEDQQTFTLDRLPRYFRRNVLQTVHYSLAALRELTRQPYQILAAKLNPLSSGKANIVLFLRFANFCEFERQMYYTPERVQVPITGGAQDASKPKIRIIPRPIVTPFGEPERGFKVTFEFLSSDGDLFGALYNTLRNFAEGTLGLHMRHIKCDPANNKISVVGQVTEKTDVEALGDRLRAFEATRSPFFPYVLKSVSMTEVTI